MKGNLSKYILLGCVIVLCVIGICSVIPISGQQEPENTPISSESTQANSVPLQSSEEAVSTEQKMEESTVASSEAAGESDEEREIKAILDSWTLEEKVAQLFFVTPEALGGSGTITAVEEQLRNGYQNHPVGGIIMMKKNLTGPEQTKEMLQDLQQLSQDTVQVPLFLGVDEEGGTVARVAGQSAFGIENVGNMADIGATGDTGQAYAAGVTIGTYLHDLGFNVDFAPVVDVWTNPENELMKKRSFGSDAEQVGDMAAEFRKGLEEQGILSCAKHFPGHGDTKEDSHEGFAFTDKTLEELRQVELVPFAKQIEQGVPFIMAGHISAPNILGDSCPSSLSTVMITDVLREEMGYDGIVITDALNMGAIANNYTSGEAAVMALQAGVDILLMPKDFPAAYNAVLEAVESGELSEERLEESLIRILKVKLEK